MKRIGLLLAVLLLAGCSSGDEGLPFEVEPDGPLGTVNGQTGIYLGVHTTVMDAEPWTSPSEFVIPSNGTFYTVDVRMRNVAIESRGFNQFRFELAMSDGTRWSTTAGWREPSLTSGTMESGETVRGWLTFDVEPNRTPTHLVWEPTFDVSLRIPLE